MREFYVQFHSLRDVLDFVNLASKQKHRLLVSSDRYQVNATSFMGIFSLNCRNRQKVSVDCTEEEMEQLLVTFERFLAK